MFRLALRSVVRQRMRSAMVAAAIAIGVIALLITEGFIKDVYHQFGNGLIHSQLGHVQVARKGYFESGFRTPEAYLLEKNQMLRKTLDARPGVKTVMPRLDFSAMLNNGKAEITIQAEAVEVAQETELTGGIRIIAGGPLTSRNSRGALVGKGVADSLRIKPGDVLTLMAPTLGGAMNSAEIEVVGVFASFSKDYDDRVVRLPLPAAQELLSTADVSRFVVLAHSRNEVDALATRLRTLPNAQPLDIKTWIDLSDIYRNTVASYEGQFGVIRMIILLLVILSVSSVVNMSIFERTGEFGTMRALGDTGALVGKLICIETLILGAIGAFLGVVIGSIIAIVLSKIGIQMPPAPFFYLGYLAEIRIDAPMLLRAFVIGLISPLPACIWPAYQMRQIPIIDALRQN